LAGDTPGGSDTAPTTALTIEAPLVAQVDIALASNGLVRLDGPGAAGAAGQQQYRGNAASSAGSAGTSGGSGGIDSGGTAGVGGPSSTPSAIESVRTRSAATLPAPASTPAR